MRKTPKLRFAEFSGEWEEKKLGSLCTFLKGSGLSKEDISADGKPCILYGELYTKYGEVISEVYSKTNLERKNFVYSKENDVLIPSSGETAIDIATASCVQDDGVILGGDLNIMRSTKINGIFLSYQLNNAKRNAVAKVAQGASVVHIYSEQLKKIVVDVPEFGEQEKLAALFSLIDTKIRKQQEKVGALEEYKKGIIQKIFSQEIRFKDENGEEYPKWKHIKLNEVAERVIRRNKGVISKLPLTISAQHGLVDQETFFNKTVASANLENYFLVCKGEFAYNKSYSAGYPWGAIKRLDNYDMGVLSSLYICFSILEGIHSDFLVHYFETDCWHKEVSMIAVEGARNHGLLNISVSDFFETLHYIPSYGEQVKIADFLTKLEKKFNKEKEKLDQLEEWKKGLLQQMFV